MTSVHAPDRTELLGRSVELVPLLKEHALDIERTSRLPETVLAALTEAGITRMRVPARYGGFESPMRTVVDVIAELARGDGATSWTVSVWSISAWMAGLFPDEVQDEIFADPRVRISGILSPGAVGVPVDGGVVLTGRWPFNSGVLHSDWNTNAAVVAHPDGSHEPVMVAVPISDLQLVDDWDTAGLCGSGSVTSVAQEVFVPQARVLPMGPVLQGSHRSVRNASSPIFQAPFMPTACTTVAATALGLAKAAKDAFFERLPGRKITYTSYADQSQAPLTHLQVAEAETKLAEAEYHAHAAAAMLDDKAAAGQPWSLEERARARLHMGAVSQRAKEAVEIYFTASGGSAIYRTVPIQRILRDVLALNQHAIMHPDTNLELYGRVLCGQEPNTLYL